MSDLILLSPRRARRALRFAALASTLVAAVLTTSYARALTMSLSSPDSLPRVSAKGSLLEKRPSSMSPEGVNLQDCLDDQRIRYPLLLEGLQASDASGRLEAWASFAGTDCSVQANRVVSSAICWRVVDSIPLSSSVSVDVPVRAIMSGYGDPRSPDATAGICGNVDLTTFAVQFLYFAPGELTTPASSVIIHTVQVDTIGPPPPSGVVAQRSSAGIRVTWDDADVTGGLRREIGMRGYCDLGEEASLDAGAEPTCSSANFVRADGARVVPDRGFEQAFGCGNVVGGSTMTVSSIGETPLTEEAPYVVAVAAIDVFGNAGALSDGACATAGGTSDPAEVSGDDRGCSTAPRSGGSWISTVTSVGLVVLGLRRRRGVGDRAYPSLPS